MKSNKAVVFTVSAILVGLLFALMALTGNRDATPTAPGTITTLPAPAITPHGAGVRT